MGWAGAGRGPGTNGKGLLCLISAAELQDHGPGPRMLGPRVSDHGPLVLVV